MYTVKGCKPAADDLTMVDVVLEQQRGPDITLRVSQRQAVEGRGIVKEAGQDKKNVPLWLDRKGEGTALSVGAQMSPAGYATAKANMAEMASQKAAPEYSNSFEFKPDMGKFGEKHGMASGSYHKDGVVIGQYKDSTTKGWVPVIVPKSHGKETAASAYAQQYRAAPEHLPNIPTKWFADVTNLAKNGAADMDKGMVQQLVHELRALSTPHKELYGNESYSQNTTWLKMGMTRARKSEQARISVIKEAIYASKELGPSYEVVQTGKGLGEIAISYDPVPSKSDLMIVSLKGGVAVMEGTGSDFTGFLGAREAELEKLTTRGAEVAEMPQAEKDRRADMGMLVQTEKVASTVAVGDNLPKTDGIALVFAPAEITTLSGLNAARKASEKQGTHSPKVAIRGTIGVPGVDYRGGKEVLTTSHRTEMEMTTLKPSDPEVMRAETLFGKMRELITQREIAAEKAGGAMSQGDVVRAIKANPEAVASNRGELTHANVAKWHKEHAPKAKTEQNTPQKRSAER